MNIDASFEIVPVWKNVTPELSAELIDLWARTGAIGGPVNAIVRARQAVCIARDADGTLCGVGTASLRILPRLRQPMYYYRQFFAPQVRGRKQTVPFFNRARQILQDHNASLTAPESLGVLVELESRQLTARYASARIPEADLTFIGYSPRGLRLYASYFQNAELFTPAPLARRRPIAL